MKSKDQVFLYDFLQLVKWADTCGADNDEFWKRVLIGSAAYPAEKQVAIAKFVAFCNTPQPNKSLVANC